MSDETNIDLPDPPSPFEPCDPFDSADLYVCVQEREEYVEETPEGAIREHCNFGYVPDGKPLIVYGFTRKVCDEEWIKSEALDLAEKLIEDFTEEFGGERCNVDLSSVFMDAVRDSVGDWEPFWCDPCGQREYSAAQVAEILGPKP